MAMQDDKYILKGGNCVYLSPEEARGMGGIRLALTVGAFNPWGQAVKKMLEYKGLKYVAVAQYAGEPNDALVTWTGSRNAPALVYDENPALIRWLDQIAFIENCKPSPALLPPDSELRAITIGICNELAGEWGMAGAAVSCCWICMRRAEKA